MMPSLFRNWLQRPRRPLRNRVSPELCSRLGGFDRLEDRTVPTLLDLTGGIGLSGPLNGAIYESVDPQPTGTGVIDPFLRVQRSPSNPSGMEHGYNTDGQEEFDTKDSGGHNWNHSLKLRDLQPVNGFYEFLLDVNESKPGALISLDELQIFVQSAPNLTGAAFNGVGTITSFQKPKPNGTFTTVAANLVYDLDGGHLAQPSPHGDSSVLLNYALNHGSGSGDMVVRIPAALLTGGTYVYLYSKFGQDVAGAGSEAGFEEWVALARRGSVGPFSLSGHKFEDVNGDGNIVSDPGLPGWQIRLFKETDGVGGWTAGDQFLGSTTTDANGFYQFTGLAANERYYVVEALPSGWIQTYGGNVENGANDFYSTLLNNNVTDLDFGNFEQFDLSGVKFRDVDRDQFKDNGEPLLGGWVIQLYKDANSNNVLDAGDGGPVATDTTDNGTGAYSFSNLGPGTYFIKEVMQAGWQQTTPGGTGYYTVPGSSGDDVANRDFGNVLSNPGSPRTKGYWRNNNGADTIAAMGGWNTVRTQLAPLFLRNEDGSLFDVAGSTYDQFATWLEDSNAQNMAYMLSAQAAAAKLNILAGAAGVTDPEGNVFPVGDTLVYAPGVNGATAAGYITIADVLAEARRILHGNNLVGDPLADLDLVSGHPLRAYAELVKTTLDLFNNNVNIVNA